MDKEQGKQTINEILSKIDIVDLISEYVVLKNRSWFSVPIIII